MSNDLKFDGTAPSFDDPNMRPRTSAPATGRNKFRIQGLEEVSEKTDEDDTSLYQKADCCASSSSSKLSNDTEIDERIAIQE